MKEQVGIKYDNEKIRWDLMCWPVLEGIAKVYTFGAKKYAEDNWKHLENGYQRYFAAAMRHISAVNIHDKYLDDESGLHHLYHAAWCLIAMAYYKDEEMKNGEQKS